MISDFRPLLGIIKASNILAPVVRIDAIDMQGMHTKVYSEQVWNIIYANTDRNFMPDITDKNAVYSLIALHLEDNKKKYIAFANKLEKLIESAYTALQNGRYTHNQILDYTVGLLILDDVISYYRTGVWNGIDYKIDSLKTQYKTYINGGRKGK